ncbi:MAG: metal-dependent hydrolase [Dehalococcoidia bacterium]
MLLFAHTGITLGLTLGWEKGLGRPIPLPSKIIPQKFDTVAREIDYRLVLVGSMLPDIIDKPIGHFFFADTFDNNGRIFAHTLLFFLLLLGYGLFRFFHYGKNGVLVVALCSGFHLILDEMWLNTTTLFWPMKGWAFPESDYEDLEDWLSFVQESAQTEFLAYISETIGLVILLAVALTLWKNKKVLSFLRRGTV